MEYIQRMRSILSKLEIPHDSAELAIQSIVKFLNSPDRTPRLNKVSFYTPFPLCKDYDKFLLNIGGEVCEFSLKNEVSTVYDALTSNGIPVAIRFHFPFLDIVSHQQKFLVSEFIRFFAAKHILKYKYSFVFSGEIIKEIRLLATELGITHQAVNKRRQKIIAKLRELMKIKKPLFSVATPSIFRIEKRGGFLYPRPFRRKRVDF
jgi:hypothetical protein